MGRHGLAAVRLRGVDWFSWATGGGSSVVILTNEIGVAEVIVTRERAYVATNRIESSRLRDEEIPRELEIHEVPWAGEARSLRAFARELAAGGAIASDRPEAGELELPGSIRELKLVLLPTEIDRYRRLGRDAASAMREALSTAQPDWSESRLAGEGARALWSRGIHATLVLVAGEERLPRYRHPFPSSKALGGRAMMVFCGRRHGLYANITRFVYFRRPTADEARLHGDIARIEAAVLGASRPGTGINSALDGLARAYESAGHGDDILDHHQGGPTGYLSREAIAVPTSVQTESVTIREGMALAWNPSLAGAKIEDTVLVGANGSLEVLTEDPAWPTTEVERRRRPDIWVRA